MKKVTLYNTRTRSLEEFKPIDPASKLVKMYCCGPTVYNYAHIGNLRTYFFEDILRRTLELAGYTVQHVMNITDVGHLQSSDDEGKDESGDDKMAVAAKRENKSPWDIAKFYEQEFFRHTDALNIIRPETICRATDHIAEMIAMVEKLIERGHAYVAGGNVYFDIKSFATYSDFARLKQDEQQATDRVEDDDRKRNPNDFALWFSDSKYPNQIMKWPSPWGTGFPGWHIECSAMATKYLGQHFDIHCGGIDHIPVHHTNEIAQSEGCFGHNAKQPWVNYWLHGEFLQVDSKKMSKSSGDFLHLDKVVADGFDPLDYRYLMLTAHYRSHLKFSYESLEHAKNTRKTLVNLMQDWAYEAKDEKPADINEIVAKFYNLVCDDLAIPAGLSFAWEIARNPDLSPATKLAAFEHFDKTFGLKLFGASDANLSEELQSLLDQREAARAAKDWALSDKLRDELLAKGVKIKDRKDGVDWEFVR